MFASVSKFRPIFSPCWSLLLNISGRPFHTAPRTLGIFGPSHDESFLKRVARKFGWMEASKSYLKLSGYLMYIKVADEVNYLNFFKNCHLEDTFVSWFSVVELHLWMLGARTMQDGKEGKFVRDAMFNALWEDCNAKSKHLEGALASARRRQIQELGQQFHAALLGYDEGLLGNDVVLAGALWRRFFQYENRQKHLLQTPEEYLRDVEALELLVAYVRSQYYNLNQLSKQHMFRRKFEFSPFDKSLIDLSDLQKISSVKI